MGIDSDVAALQIMRNDVHTMNSSGHDFSTLLHFSCSAFSRHHKHFHEPTSYNQTSSVIETFPQWWPAREVESTYTELFLEGGHTNVHVLREECKKGRWKSM